MNDLKQKEQEVKISSLTHNILESELKVLKKLEEIERINATINQFKQALEQLQGK